MVDFAVFRPVLEIALARSDRAKGGRPPLDAVRMFKVLVLQALYGLSDAQAEFQLSDAVHRFIPEWKDLKVREKSDDGSSRLVEPQRPMSVRDLLMHMSGLGFAGRGLPLIQTDDESGPAVLPSWEPGATLETVAERLADRALRFHPGTRWFYSTSTDMCARLVEIISGQRFDEYLQRAVFGPLQMVDTGFMVPDTKIERFAANYSRTSDKKLALARYQSFDAIRHLVPRVHQLAELVAAAGRLFGHAIR